jgi:hypothetical protein
VRRRLRIFHANFRRRNHYSGVSRTTWDDVIPTNERVSSLERMFRWTFLMVPDWWRPPQTYEQRVICFAQFLLIRLTRKYWSGARMRTDCYQMEFPKELDLMLYIFHQTSPIRYQMGSVLSRRGQSQLNGHYVTLYCIWDDRTCVSDAITARGSKLDAMKKISRRVLDLRRSRTVFSTFLRRAGQ